MHAKQIALGAPVTAQEIAMGNLPLSAQERLSQTSEMKPLAKALVQQYLDTFSSLHEAMAGRKSRKFPGDLVWEKREHEVVFTSSANSNWSAELADDGSLTISNGRRKTSFCFSGNHGPGYLVRTVDVAQAGERLVKRDEVDLSKGSRQNKSYRIEALESASSGNFGYCYSDSQGKTGNAAY